MTLKDFVSCLKANEKVEVFYDEYEGFKGTRDEFIVKEAFTKFADHTLVEAWYLSLLRDTIIIYARKVEHWRYRIL